MYISLVKDNDTKKKVWRPSDFPRPFGPGLERWVTYMVQFLLLYFVSGEKRGFVYRVSPPLFTLSKGTMRVFRTTIESEKYRFCQNGSTDQDPLPEIVY